MRPSDPRLRAQLVPARRPLLVVGAAGVAGSLLLIAQAFVVTGLVLAVIDSSRVFAWALATVAAFAARALVGWLSDVYAARAAAVVGRDLRRKVMGALLRRRPEDSTGSLSALATRGVSAAEPYLTRYLPALVLAGVLPVLTLVAIAVLDPMSGLIVLVTLPLIPVFGILVGLATRDRATSQWRALAALSGHFLDVMRGLPTLVAYRRAEAQSATIRAVTDHYRRRTLATLRIAFASSAILELVATISVALVAVTVGIRLANGDLSLHTALVVLLLAPEAYWPLRRVGTEFHAAAEGVATFEATADLTDPSHPGERSQMALSHPGERSQMVLREVSVTYPGRAWPAVAPVDLDLSARGVTAVVGPSGCGKSTLLRVLAGLTEPTTGSVRLDSLPLGAPGWRERVAYLPQRPVFVAGSIAENLRLAAPEASDQELWSALRQVALEERVAALGLDADLAEDGASLSAGERARLALARIVLADRPWVLLDEPTAHLDPVTEQVIADTVLALGRRAAVVLVAHRAALVELADEVVRLQPVEVEEGPSAPVHRPVQGPSATAHADLEGPSAPGRRGLWGAAVLGGLANVSGVALTALAGWLIVRAAAMPGILTLTVAMVGVRTFGLARPGLRYVERLRSHDAALRLLAEERVKVYDALVPLTPGALGRRRGDVLAAMVDDVDCVLDQELRVRLPLRAFGVTAVLAVAATAWLSPVAGAVTALTCLAAAGGFLLARRGTAVAEAALVEARADLSDAVVGAAQTAEELVMWQAEGRALAAVDEAGARAGAATMTSARWLGAGRAWTLAATGVAIAGLALLLRDRVADGSLSGPVLALLLLVPLAMAEATTGLADAGAAAARTAAAHRRLRAIAARTPAVSDPPRPRPAPESAELGVDRVAAHWGDRSVLDGLELRLAPGEKVAVVGPSGSGKSTLADLLLRFRDPDEGSVRMAGVDYPELALASVRERVGYVDDDPHVFASSLVENVRFARPGASDGQVEDALRRAHLGRWLDALPAGVHTRLGDGGSAVSGGERARLAIARALLADTPVLVLDEPVAHLDSATAAEIAEEVLGQERSVVWITHASAGLDRVHRIVELATGAEGTR